MAKINLLVLMGIIVSASAHAETTTTAPAVPPSYQSAEESMKLEYLAAADATTPRRGDSKAPTLTHRTIRDRDEHLENRICSNC